MGTKEVRYCKICNSKFEFYKCHSKRLNRGFYCSKKCFYQSRKGKQPWNKGLKTGIIPKSIFKEGLTPWNKDKKRPLTSFKHRQNLSLAIKGRILTEEHKRKIGLGNKKYVGALASNWQGGKSFEIYPKGWRELREHIRKRDAYKCLQCGCSQLDCTRKLDIHHIDFNKNNLDWSNLISLCRSCHTKVNKNPNLLRREYGLSKILL